MKMLRRSGIAALAILALVTAAWAIQPGTSGTDKRLQQSGERSGVLIQVNNTATSVGAQTGTATLNAAGSGVITTPSIAITADSEYALTLTNSMIEAGDVVLASANLGSSAVGSIYVAEVKPAAGSVLIRVRNASGATTLAGTIQIRFLVIKQSALGSD
jgi:hypothetical protein